MSRQCRFKDIFILLFFILGWASSHSSDESRLVYHGLIKEDAMENDEVELDMQLFVKDKASLTGDICGYTIYKSHSELPFKIELLDKKTGSARILLASETLDHETKHEYTFEVAAHDCTTGKHAPREKVHIEVEDVNEYVPVWSKQSYYAEVVEGRLGEHIVHLEATDEDGTDGASKICHYHIVTSDVPFEIDNEGDLHNTEKLDYNKRHNYILEVTAEDCGGRFSEKAIVNIEVKAVCRPGWTGIADRVEFTPRDGQKLVFPAAELETCETGCNLTQVSVTVKLTTAHIGKGCDRDTYSLQSQRKICGASDGSIDLLPSPTLGGWTKDLPTDDGQESDQIFAFDGVNTAIEIPPSKIGPDFGHGFTISTWMKHEDTETNAKGAKEHILCHADGEEMNRHHYSVFVHNCRLVLLMRQEPGAGVDMNVFQPAEWRWRIPEVCDGKWHHYAVSVEFPQVRLYVDGKQFIESKHNPEIVDDWPLHESKHVHFTKLVVGACWQGGKHRLGQYFRGYLAGLSVLRNKTETDSVIQCLTSCQEKLDFTAMDAMETGMSVSMNNEMTTITISGSKLEAVEKLVQRVGYINTRTFPTPGHRPVTFETHATCSDGKELSVDAASLLIMVLEAEKPVIVLSATKKISRDEDGVVRGEKMFTDLTITAHTKTEADELKSAVTESSDAEQEPVDNEEEDPTLRDRYKLDSCLIRIDPQMNLNVEHLNYPENLVAKLGLEVDLSEDGLVIAGADKLGHYEQVLRGIHYVNKKPQELNSRTFVLSCTELNGRFVSNQLEVMMSVVHVDHEPSPVPHAIAADKISLQAISNKQPMAGIAGVNHIQKPVETQQTGIGVAVVIIVCIGFVVLLVVLGVTRIRNTRRHSRDGVNVDEKQEMEWDNSALTITVNPMDQEVTMYDEEATSAGCHGDDTDSEEEECSYHGDDVESSEEEEETKVKSRELEWDDSTLSF